MLTFDIITSFIICFSLISLYAVVIELFSLWSVLYTSLCEGVSSQVVPVCGSVWTDLTLIWIHIRIIQ
jgi:hypothetical protein